MNLHVPVRDRSPQAQALTEEAAFRERLLAIRHHRYRARISLLASKMYL